MKNKKSRFLRSISVMLVFIVTALTFIVACDDSDANSENSNDNSLNAEEQNSENINVTEPTTEDPYPEYNDGLGKYDFNGEEFKIQVAESAYKYRIITEEQNGELFNDALYKRNRIIEDRFNVVIKEVITGDFTNGDTKNIILSGDATAFDIFDSRCPDVLTNWQEGLTVPYNKIPVIDLSKPYWNNTANKTLTLNNIQYIALGNFNFASYEISHALLFNKSMINNFALENPYLLVREGKWTFSKMEDMMKAVINDLNGDGVMDDKDRYGYLSSPKQVLPNFWIAGGAISVGKDEKDTPYLAMGNEKFMSVFDRTFTMLWDTGAYHLSTGPEDIPSDAIKMFSNNQSLFMDSSFWAIESMRSMETDFGIIPYPKFDESQQNYISRIEYYWGMQLPITNTDPERAGVMLEALNSGSAKTIMPAYQEIALKTKYARDDESAEMLDLIVNTLIVDIGDTTLCSQIRDGFMAGMFEKNNRNLTSKIESTEKIIKSFIDKIPID